MEHYVQGYLLNAQNFLRQIKIYYYYIYMCGGGAGVA